MDDDKNPIVRWVGQPVRWMQIACGWALMAICFLTLYDIVARRLFSHSVQGVAEVGAYMLAIMSAFGFSSALLQKSHSRVDFLFPWMPKVMISVLNVLAAISLAAVAVISTWQVSKVLGESIRFDSHSTSPLQTPMWIPQGLWLVGLGVFAGVSTACAVHALILFFTDRAKLDDLYGPLSLEGQIELETGGTVAATEGKRQ